MINLLIRYCIAAATVSFMVSLPLGKSELASTLRRTSGALFLLAFAPYVFVDLVHTLPQSSDHAISGASVLEVIGGFALLAPLAYVILALRRRFKTTTGADADFARLRSSGKRPVEADPHTSVHQLSLFDEEPGP